MIEANLLQVATLLRVGAAEKKRVAKGFEDLHAYIAEQDATGEPFTDAQKLARLNALTPVDVVIAHDAAVAGYQSTDVLPMPGG